MKNILFALVLSIGGFVIAQEYVVEITGFPGTDRPKLGDRCISVKDFKKDFGKGFDKMCPESSGVFYCSPGMSLPPYYAIKFKDLDSCNSAKLLLLRVLLNDKNLFESQK